MHVLSVSSLKGGVGKTTITLGLASAAFARGLRTLVVDLDPQCDASTGLGAIGASKATVADVLKNPRHNVVLDSIVPSSWGKVQSGHIDVMIGSPRALVFDVPSPTVREVWKLEEALSRVENDYDLVLIDTPPSMNGLTRTAWVASDRVLVVSEPSIFSVVAAERALRAIEELRRDISPRLHSVGVLINRLRPLSREHDFRIQELKNMLGNAVLEVQLEEKSTIQQAQGAARPIHTWPGEGARNIAIEFESILDFIESSFAERDIKRTRAKASKFAKFRKIMRGQKHQAELTEDVEALLSDTAESVSRREES
ncbi:ParA family protein [Rhodoluna limnophila]|uniref:ParA family protein n=1 Tax=Rhodoluna limnophila TaxID=232537 RepID=UPI0011074210|nr:ParA family protein [Rhodoluna limnophila]